MSQVIQDAVRKLFPGQKEEPTIKPVSGGSINSAYRIGLDDKQVFVKMNDRNAFPQMFETEKKGLDLLKANSQFHIPKVIDVVNDGNDAMIFMEWIEPGARESDYWRKFGRRLAEMHRSTNEEFGLDHDNYIGSLPQRNNRHSTWADFFIEERLQPMIEQARNDSQIDQEDISAFESLFARLPEIFPEEPPSLVHGDLWSGNYMTGPGGAATIIDPAVYYGHREMDLGMTKLFGGFDREFYDAYHEEFNLEPGWEERLDLANLYPLMVHVNLFGRGYLGQVKQILRRFA